VLANKVYMLSDQGFVEISDTGVQVRSWDIEPEVLPLLTYSGLGNLTYGIAYESERSYLLSTVSNSSDTEPTQTFVYNVFTNAWTVWDFGMVSGVVEPNSDKLFFSKANEAKIYQERKSFTTGDYADPEFAITITSISGLEVTFTHTGDVPQTGWAIEQGSSALIIDSIIDNGGGSYTATMTSTLPDDWEEDSATLYPSIVMDIRWNTWAPEPGLMKFLKEFKILTDDIASNNSTSEFIATYKTDLDGEIEEVPLNTDSSGWGDPWGEIPWGGVSDNNSYRDWIPRNKHYCARANFGVKHRRALEKVAIAGYSLEFDFVSGRTGK